MSLTLPQTCNMGSSQTGLVGTIGVELLNPDGTTKTARATAGVYEIGGGAYGKEITFDDDWSGVIVWDTGGGTPYYATVEYNIEGMVAAVPSTTAIADAVLDEIVAGGYTLRQLCRGFVAVLAGISSGGGTSTLTFRDTGDTKDVVVATVDINGNRTSVTLDLT